MWFFLYMLGVLGFVIGSIMAIYHCIRYGTAWDQTRTAVIIYTTISATFLAVSVVLAANLALI